MAYLNINVTQEHIDKASQYISTVENPEVEMWCKSCPIALAAKDVVPGFINVGPKFISIRIGDFWGYYHLELPIAAIDFIRKADTQRSVRAGLSKADEYDFDQEKLKPFQFVVYIPDDLIRQET